MAQDNRKFFPIDPIAVKQHAPHRETAGLESRYPMSPSELARLEQIARDYEKQLIRTKLAVAVENRIVQNFIASGADIERTIHAVRMQAKEEGWTEQFQQYEAYSINRLRAQQYQEYEALLGDQLKKFRHDILNSRIGQDDAPQKTTGEVFRETFLFGAFRKRR